MSNDEIGGDTFEDLLAEAETSFENVEEYLGDVDRLEEVEDSELESLLGDIDTLARVAEEAVELITALDLSDLPDAVDGEELLEAIEVGELPNALADEETDVDDAVDLTQALRAINLMNAWSAADLGDIWQEKREFEEAVDDLAAEGEDEDAGVVETTASAVADKGADVVGDDGELIETDMDATSAAKEALGKPDVENDPEAYQAFIQQQAMTGIDAFRTALLETHAKFEALYEMNREKMRRQNTSPSSRNPTAASTIATNRRDFDGGARYSTVPQQVKLSTAPTRKRIYGRRFEIERKKRRDDDE